MHSTSSRSFYSSPDATLSPPRWKIELYQRLLMRLRPAVLASFMKRMLGIRRVVASTRNGRFWIDPVSHLGTALIHHGEYQPKMTQALVSFLQPGSVFLDLGAHEGYFSVVAGQLVGAAGRVVSVEPQRRLEHVILRNLALNGVEAGLFTVAVSDSCGHAALHLSPDMNTGASGLSRPTRYRVNTQDVRTVTLSRLLDQACIEKVDLLKMDIEGYEYEAILGSPGLFRDGSIRAIALEVHGSVMERRGRDPRQIVSFLEECGYVADPRFENKVYVRRPAGNEILLAGAAEEMAYA